MWGCVDYLQAPQQPISVAFDVPDKGGYIHCMYQRGDAFTLSVTEAGLTCGKFGYIESKRGSSDGDLFASDESYWSTTYTATNPGNSTSPTRSGSKQTKWYHVPFGGNIQLWNQNGNVLIHRNRDERAGIQVYTPDYEVDKVYVSDDASVPILSSTTSC